MLQLTNSHHPGPLVYQSAVVTGGKLWKYNHNASNSTSVICAVRGQGISSGLSCLPSGVVPVRNVFLNSSTVQWLRLPPGVRLAAFGLSGGLKGTGPPPRFLPWQPVQVVTW